MFLAPLLLAPGPLPSSPLAPGWSVASLELPSASLGVALGVSATLAAFAVQRQREKDAAPARSYSDLIRRGRSTSAPAFRDASGAESRLSPGARAMLQRAYDNIESEREEALRVGDTEGAADVVAVCGSMLAHRLLDLLRPLTDELEVAADLCKSSLCCFLNWIFEGYPKVLEAVHLQRYAEPLVSVLVREVDALRGCLHLMEQLLGRMAPPSTRGFEFLLAVELVSVERDRQLRVW